jgi:hypothetical protein
MKAPKREQQWALKLASTEAWRKRSAVEICTGMIAGLRKSTAPERALESYRWRHVGTTWRSTKRN